MVRHIEYLLMHNDYAIIPGLGGFVLHARPARLTAEGVLPPCHTVGFNVRMDSNDGLLATEVMRAEGMNYRSALAWIENEVAAIRHTLHTGARVQIGRLGYLMLNEERQLTFCASDTRDVLPHDFGLHPLHIAQRRSQKAVTFTLPAGRNLLRYAASILVLMALLLFSPRMGDGSISHLAGVGSPLSLIDTVETHSQATEEDSEEAPAALPHSAMPKRYHIVVSCLPSRTSADRYCELLQAKHHDNARVLPSVRTNRVVIESFADRDIAALYLHELRKSHREFQDAWLHQELINEEK